MIEDRLKRLPELELSGHLVRLGRHFSGEFVVAVDDKPFHVVADKGRIVEVLEGPFKMRAFSFAVRASGDAWTKFCASVPEPGFHDIFAMSGSGNARIEGDMAPLLHNLRYFKELLALMRSGG